MAQIFPHIPDDGTPTSERIIFEALRQGLSNDTIVFHSRRYKHVNDRKKIVVEGEADFIIIDPSRGWLVLEVKGGEEIGRNADGWFSVDHYGKAHKIKDPGRQAQSNIHSIARFFSETNWFGNLPVPKFAWAVAFPGVDLARAYALDINKSYVFSRADLQNPQGAIDRIFDSHGISAKHMQHDARKRLIEAFSPQFNLVALISTRISEQEIVLVRMTQEQLHILDMNEDVLRLGVKGGAGTGKTLVAIERAKRLAANGKRVLFLCFNQPLAHHLAKDAPGITVKTFHEFGKKIIEQATGTFNVPGDPKEQSLFWDQTVPELMLDAADALPDGRYDAIIVDEGQDFKELWWLVIEKMLADESRSSLWVFSDPAQRIYEGLVPDSLKLVPAKLTYNCRNTKRIAKHADKLIERETVMKPDMPEGLAVKTIEAPSPLKANVALRDELERLVDQNGIRTDQIVILSPYRFDKSWTAKAGALGRFRLIDSVVPGAANEVRFSSIHRFKGLEADVVIICDMLDSVGSSQRQISYIGATRAKHMLMYVQNTP